MVWDHFEAIFWYGKMPPKKKTKKKNEKPIFIYKTKMGLSFQGLSKYALDD
jgi:hypothetical protein